MLQVYSSSLDCLCQNNEYSNTSVESLIVNRPQCDLTALTRFANEWVYIHEMLSSGTQSRSWSTLLPLDLYPGPFYSPALQPVFLSQGPES